MLFGPRHIVQDILDSMDTMSSYCAPSAPNKITMEWKLNVPVFGFKVKCVSKFASRLHIEGYKDLDLDIQVYDGLLSGTIFIKATGTQQELDDLSDDIRVVMA